MTYSHTVGVFDDKGRVTVWMCASVFAAMLAGTAHGAAGKTVAKKLQTRASVAKKPAKHTAAPAKGRGKKEHTVNARKIKSRPPAVAPTPQSVRLISAFQASSQLRPMAQQLASTRSTAAYAGVQAYARMHPGDGAATALLALGHASMLDHRYPEAVVAYKQASQAGDALGDYADFLGAQADLQATHGANVSGLLDRFAERHPGSIFIPNVPVLLANADVQQGNSQAAIRILEPLTNTPQGGHAGFRSMLARAYQTAGDTAQAATLFRNLYLNDPLSPEATQAKTQLQAMGVQLSAAERKTHADRLYDAKHYAEAAAEYHDLQKNDGSLSPADHAALDIYAAVCDLKLKRLTLREVDNLPQTGDDSAALKLYLVSELDRNADNRAGHDDAVAQMVSRFPHSRWLEEALYSGGNMYLVKRDAAKAIEQYTLLVQHFPNSTYAPSAHWRAAWMCYRLRRYADAARLMDEQIQQYPGGLEVPSALYWRGRLLEEQERNFGQAVVYYRALSASYPNFYYALLARQRLTVLATQAPAEPAPVLISVKPPLIPELTGELPENDTHLIKARLLANAALNEYIGPEIMASPTSGQWGALAQAQIYASFGEYTRSLQSIKHSGISFFALPFDRVPTVYWRLLFPQPYWTDLVADSERNGLDPFLVASLIRQESEFNAGVISHANAYGLMQLLPSVGKAAAKKLHLKGFSANQLLNPAINLQLGTLNLREVLDRFGGQKEYALAAYNAGDVPIRQWLAAGDYKDIPEFVESIPYTETRDYVQAILRNRELYRQLYPTK